MPSSFLLPPTLFFLLLPLFLFHSSVADVVCPKLPHGVQLNCARACCQSHEGQNQGFYCCDPNSANVVDPVAYTSDHRREPARADRFSTVYSPMPMIEINWPLLLLGLLISVFLSVLLSFLCCLLCNGCWLHRRRNPHMYENVGERRGDPDDGFYHICCGFGIPVGTVVFSNHPPQFAEGPYGGSSVDSARNNRVRFNHDGTPMRGVLKNGNEGPPMGGDGGFR